MRLSVKLAGVGLALRRIAAGLLVTVGTISTAWAAGEAEPKSYIAPASPVGRWLTEDRGGVIDIAPCGAALCGRIIGMAEPVQADGKPKTDSAGRPKCGLTILHNGVQTEPGQWSAKITNPDDGSDWNCVLSVDGDHRLHLRGYVLVPLFGQTQLWTVYSGKIGAGCRIG